MIVDPRPQLERDADRALRVIVLGIAGCALLGAGIGIQAALWLTTPKKEH